MSFTRFELLVPILDARRLGAHEVVEVDRLVRLPDALRSAEILDAASGRNAGTGEDEDAVSVADEITELHAVTQAEAW